jgi:hypothetical protein
MALVIDYEVSQRKKFKRNRVKAHQRFMVRSSPPESEFKDPDSILINKIINNIKQETRGKNNE